MPAKKKLKAVEEGFYRGEKREERSTAETADKEGSFFSRKRT